MFAIPLSLTHCGLASECASVPAGRKMAASLAMLYLQPSRLMGCELSDQSADIDVTAPDVHFPYLCARRRQNQLALLLELL
jgi:hypothetical protein